MPQDFTQGDFWRMAGKNVGRKKIKKWKMKKKMRKNEKRTEENEEKCEKINK